MLSSKNSVTKFESSSDPLLLKLCKWTIAILNGVWGALNKMLKTFRYLPNFIHSDAIYLVNSFSSKMSILKYAHIYF